MGLLLLVASSMAQINPQECRKKVLDMERELFDKVMNNGRIQAHIDIQETDFQNQSKKTGMDIEIHYDNTSVQNEHFEWYEDGQHTFLVDHASRTVYREERSMSDENNQMKKMLTDTLRIWMLNEAELTRCYLSDNASLMHVEFDLLDVEIPGSMMENMAYTLDYDSGKIKSYKVDYQEGFSMKSIEMQYSNLIVGKAKSVDFEKQIFQGNQLAHKYKGYSLIEN